MKYLHIEYENRDIAVFDFDGNYKPREAEVVATIAAALLEEKSGSIRLDEHACMDALHEVACGDRPLKWSLENEI